MSSVIKNLPFHLQVYQILRESILTGRMKPGERLLELKLSQELGVSRSPVREAMRMLEQDGLVLTAESGTIVNPMEIEDVREIYQCRIASEPYAGFLAASKITPAELAEMENLVNQAQEAYGNGEFQQVAELTTAFHDLIVKASGNRRLSDIIDRIRSLIILARNMELKTYARPRDFLEEHQEILFALQKGNSSNVEALLRKHIENDWDYYLTQHKD
ncbi:GntR family transcriptional regulator [Desulfosporosinus sp. PR]|uniref:GntR family transcriptional regulator n=1 Tax=Candidatus Desulfosporosinus nitrosoreducens TaxID=3401928 RepID=UPI0027E7A4C0|nr:GntR family transcriptional regulator [Desulfosporosinus sp. PR]MDQ7094373.1 GntR family transcriptional regulator [Desulfosporosinus sp. PR]